jgi:murein DD-endopeptidase MepM/ murein hydrolase activator NlpD
MGVSQKTSFPSSLTEAAEVGSFAKVPGGRRRRRLLDKPLRKGLRMRWSSRGKCRSIWRVLAGAVVTVVAAFVAVVGPPATSASAETFPMVFPFETRLPVTHQFMVPRSGHLHQGMDLVAPKMTKLLAVVSGTVTLQMRIWNGQPWYSLWLVGDDGRGYYYSHINNDTPGTDDGLGDLRYAFAPGLVTGSRVAQGQFIAYCGDSGNAEGGSPHLHFEIHETGEWGSPALDPYDSLFAAPLADGTPAPEWPSRSLNRYEETDTRITYTGVWNSVAEGVASGGTYRAADSRANAVIWFEGTSLAWFAARGPQQGAALVSLDGQEPVPVDLKSETVAFGEPVWSTGLLPQGTHTVTITWAEAADHEGNSQVNIDAVEVMGTLIQAPQVATSQQSSSLLRYVGAWTTFPTTQASGDSLATANAAGSSLPVDFTGFCISLLSARGPAYGQALVTVDGGTPEVVDLYNPSTMWRQKVWNSGYLPYGRHLVTIEWTGLKNAASTGTAINVDALEMVGCLTQNVFPTPTTIYPRYEQNDTRLAYSGTWTPVSTPYAYGGSFRYANSSGSSVNVAFSGTYIAWIAKKSPVYGKAKVILDGGTPETVDLYASSEEWKQTVWEKTLPDGPHTLRIEWTGLKNSAATNTNISVDAFAILGTLTQATSGSGATATRYEQDNSKLAYSGTWITFLTSGASGGSYKYADSPASVTITFSGTRLDWIATQGYTQGKALVSLDGGPGVKVNLYNSTTKRQVLVWSTGTLAAGTHTVTISWTGEAGAAGGGTRVNVDAVDVVGS